MFPKMGGEAWIILGDGANSVACSGQGNLGKDPTGKQAQVEGGSVVERVGLT